MDSDGLLLLDFSILGQNPNQQQAVNFNYHHEENILTLLRSLRLTDSVQNQIEKKIKKAVKSENILAVNSLSTIECVYA